jgi:uncharacterized protein (DUF2235 family)
MSDLDPQSEQPKPPNQPPTDEPVPMGTGKPNCDQPSREQRRPKNIFVCCDGTGNEFAAKDSLDGNSNVVKLYTALHLGLDQVAYYHPGVGTMGDPGKKGLAREWSVVKGLAFGWGFRDNVLDAYRYLMQHYASGDRVFIFGFSRGAYTARALAGLLHGYGLLCRGNEGHIPYAWRMYTEKTATEKELNAHTISTDTTFRDTFSHKTFSIHFVGLWDTVSSVGWITTPLRLLDMAQNPTIERGRHAVSIDERRCFYQDNLWGKPVEVNVPPILQGTQEAAAMPRRQDLLQVWFAGVHSDVGGSYPQLQSGLANIALRWMIDETRHAGACFDEARVRMVLGTPGPGEPTPETAALAPLYEKPKSFKLHRSLHGIWWLLELFPHRFYDKDDASMRIRVPLGAYRKIPRGSLVHPTVKDRFATHPCYKPKNMTGEELIAVPADAGLAPEASAYLYFEPMVCRDDVVRENWFVVLLVMVIELGATLYLAFYLVAFLAWLAWRYVHPVTVSLSIWSTWLALRQFVTSHLFAWIGPWADLALAMLVAAVYVLLQRTVAFFRKP